MNLDELQAVQSKERQKDSLQHLRPSFYQEVGEYIGALKEERDQIAAGVDDPFASPEVNRLTDEIETARDVVDAIYERRMGKLVKQASLAAAGMAADDEGLTAEEEELFADLVVRIETNKGRVLDVLEGNVDASSVSEQANAPTSSGEFDERDEPPADHARSTDETDSEDKNPPPTPDSDPDGVSAADVMGGDLPPPAGSEQSSTDTESKADPNSGATLEPGTDHGTGASQESGTNGRKLKTESTPTGSEPGETEDDGDSVDRLTVRITRDIGDILGVDDREYSLATDDVVTLPEQNAMPLVDQDAAEPLE